MRQSVCLIIKLNHGIDSYIFLELIAREWVRL